MGNSVCQRKKEQSQQLASHDILWRQISGENDSLLQQRKLIDYQQQAIMNYYNLLNRELEVDMDPQQTQSGQSEESENEINNIPISPEQRVTKMLGMEGDSLKKYIKQDLEYINKEFERIKKAQQRGNLIITKPPLFNNPQLIKPNTIENQQQNEIPLNIVKQPSVPSNKPINQKELPPQELYNSTMFSKPEKENNKTLASQQTFSFPTPSPRLNDEPKEQDSELFKPIKILEKSFSVPINTNSDKSNDQKGQILLGLIEQKPEQQQKDNIVIKNTKKIENMTYWEKIQNLYLETSKIVQKEKESLNQEDRDSLKKHFETLNNVIDQKNFNHMLIIKESIFLEKFFQELIEKQQQALYIILIDEFARRVIYDIVLESFVQSEKQTDIEFFPFEVKDKDVQNRTQNTQISLSLLINLLSLFNLQYLKEHILGMMISNFPQLVQPHKTVYSDLKSQPGAEYIVQILEVSSDVMSGNKYFGVFQSISQFFFGLIAQDVSFIFNRASQKEFVIQSASDQDKDVVEHFYQLIDKQNFDNTFLQEFITFIIQQKDSISVFSPIMAFELFNFSFSIIGSKPNYLQVFLDQYITIIRKSKFFLLEKPIDTQKVFSQEFKILNQTCRDMLQRKLTQFGNKKQFYKIFNQKGQMSILHNPYQYLFLRDAPPKRDAPPQKPLPNRARPD